MEQPNWTKTVSARGGEYALHGRIAPGFDQVADAFAENFRVEEELGAGCSGVIDGRTVVDLWVDRMEMMFRYAEVQLAGSDKRVLLPMTFARIKKDGTHVQAILGHQFVNVPQTKSNEQITLLEEEKITAYYGAGTL